MFWKSKVSYTIPEMVGPQKLPRAKEEVNKPETTACTSMLSGNPACTAAIWAEPKLATRRAEQPKPWKTREPQTDPKVASYIDDKYGAGPMRPKQIKMRTAPQDETTQGERAESHIHPNRGVATTEQMDIMRKQTAMCLTSRSIPCKKGDKVASRDPIL